MLRQALRACILSIARLLPEIGHHENAERLERHARRHDLAAWLCTAGREGEAIWSEIAGALETAEHLAPRTFATRSIRRSYEKANDLMGQILAGEEAQRRAARLEPNRAVVVPFRRPEPPRAA